jgi:hypothetical protein
MARRVMVGVFVTGILAAGIIAPLALLLRSISGGESGPPIGVSGESPTESPSPPLTTFSDPEDGLTIQAPADWHFDTNPVPNLLDPKIDFALGSWVFPSGDFGPTELPCPNQALRELPGDGTFIWIEEYKVSDLGPETAQLFESSLQSAVFEDKPVTGGCGNVPYYVLRFRDGQRAFAVSAAFGSSTGAGQQEAVLEIVRSITVEGG